MAYAHPASIQARVGACLTMIELNIEQTDYAGLSNFVRLLETYVAPYQDDSPDLWEANQAIERFSYDQKGDAFECLMKRVEYCLLILRKENIYGYDTAPLGDGSALELPVEAG